MKRKVAAKKATDVTRKGKPGSGMGSMKEMHGAPGKMPNMPMNHGNGSQMMRGGHGNGSSMDD